MQADGGPLAQDPLHGHETYETVRAPIAPRLRPAPRRRRPPAAAAQPPRLTLRRAHLHLHRLSALQQQVKFLNRGAYGVVVLARERATGREWALKFIERGPLVGWGVGWLWLVGWVLGVFGVRSEPSKLAVRARGLNPQN
jgi:hypothetical protein